MAVCTCVFPLLVKTNRRTVPLSCDTKKQRKNCINKLLHYCLLTEGQQYSEKSLCICILQATLLISIRRIKFTRQNIKQSRSNHINTNENFSRDKKTLKSTCSVCSSWQQQHTSPHRTCTSSTLKAPGWKAGNFHLTLKKWLVVYCNSLLNFVIGFAAQCGKC